MQFEGKTALVTGGASGIGRAIADLFVAYGANVVIFDRHAGPGHVRGDVSKEADVRCAVEIAASRFGQMDVLVNNAGIEVEGRVEDLSGEAWDRQLAVNLRGPFLCSKHAIPYMKQRGGAIVNVSSIDAFAGYPGLAAYDSSKAALIALTRTLALECGPARIRVNAVCPGYIETPLLDAYFQRQPDPAGARREAALKHPLGRMGKPSDVAGAVAFLASEKASFITGTTLVVDGGLLAVGH